MIEPRQYMRAGTAASVVGHMAVLYVGLMFANARPFDYTPSETIAIDIVTPEQASEPPKPVEPPKAEPPKPVEQKQPDPIDFSALTAPTVPIQTFEPVGQKKPAQKAARPASPPTAQQASTAQQTSSAQQASVGQQAALSQQASTASQSAEPQRTDAPQPAMQPPVQPAVPSAQPDVTVKYGVLLGLPTMGPPAAGGYSGFDAPAVDLASIDSNNIMEFRRHLKSCSMLPASVAPTDRVRIVLRVLLTQTGRLAAEPILIEASASAKGPLLMQKAMEALQACQPYTMLPADKYKEWKVLDLAFTPHDFTGG
jgi:hypothetical protein